MLKLFWLLLSGFLIFVVFLRTPQNNGLASFATKSSLLGSASSERFLNNLTTILIITYLVLAIILNFNNL